MSVHRKVLLLFVCGLAAVLVTVWLGSANEHRVADRMGELDAAGQDMLAAFFDQERGVLGFELTGDDAALRVYTLGARDFDTALADARHAAGGFAPALELLDRMELIVGGWRQSAEAAIKTVQEKGPRSVSLAEIEIRAEMTSRLRAVQESLQETFQHHRHDKVNEAGYISVGLVGGVALLFAFLGWVLIGRRMRREDRRRAHELAHRERQRELGDAMQVVRTEPEAHALIKRHLERTLATSSVVVLTCNNSENRLLPATQLNGDAELEQRLLHAEPDSCLAVRSGRAHREKPGEEQLVSCELCSGSGQSTTCVPALVGGEVIGSILIHHDAPFEKEEWRNAVESISHTAPSLANLRTLAIAESRAATDALTGLPNRRALDDSLKRLIAQSGRTLSPLSAILFDLDDFKKINDVHGHAKGDEVLAAVGAVVSSVIRGSDTAGRSGGEEFLALLPNTDRHGALVLAEKLRGAISRIAVAGVGLPISGSFGVAAYPDDGMDAARLLRAADRALYMAKANGKNRIEVATAPDMPLDDMPIEIQKA